MLGGPLDNIKGSMELSLGRHRSSILSNENISKTVQNPTKPQKGLVRELALNFLESTTSPKNKEKQNNNVKKTIKAYKRNRAKILTICYI